MSPTQPPSDATVRLRPAEPRDESAILDLIDRHRGVGLSARERAERGFVQGEWTPATLAALADGPGIWVAEEAGTLAGVAISSAPGTVGTGPAGETNRVAAEVFGPGRYFLYGPVVVDEAFRGRGILRGLLTRLLEANVTTYAVAVAFIESTNTLSQTVHARLGWRRIGGFALGERSFDVLGLPTDPDGTLS
ncbi:GNAT family N-acetyltransferase [Nocardioides sp.]|uniref:GNAT family N-acetyltransferase n=1 Tax=Nocardioides sp. TaxID=35761 RepID=UPI002601E8E4|nr:GNAT family N-acetyltransferase [Nocardioides sp.]